MLTQRSVALMYCVYSPACVGVFIVYHFVSVKPCRVLPAAHYWTPSRSQWQVHSWTSPAAFPPTLTSPLREGTVCGEAFHPDSQPQLDASVVFLIDTEISSRAALSSSASPLALPQCSTRWYSLVKSETVAAGGEEGGFLCVCLRVCASVCLRVSSD